MPMDSDVAALLSGAAQSLRFPAEAIRDPALAATYLASVRAALSVPATGVREPLYDIVERVMPSGRRIRVYRATVAATAPVVIYFHGGGWVSGGLEMNDGLCRRLANLTGCVLVSVDYRLAPEHPYPAALDDCLEALAWVSTAADEFGGDPAHLSVAGTSSGGNLAAAVALVGRDRGLRALKAQLLVYPVLDAAMATPSYTEYAAGYLLEQPQMQWYWDQYLPQRAADVPIYAAPASADDLAGLAPAVIVSAEFDPLRDEAERYAARLRAADVSTRLLRIDGQIHGFLSFLGVVRAADAAIGEISRALLACWQTGD